MISITIIVLMLALLVGAFFLFPFFAGFFQYADARASRKENQNVKFAKDKAGLSNISFKNMFKLSWKIQSFFIFPQQKHFKVIDKTIATPLSEFLFLFNIGQEKRGGELLGEAYNNYLHSHVNNETVNEKTKIDMDMSNKILFNFKKKELVSWGIISLIYMIAFALVQDLAYTYIFSGFLTSIMFTGVDFAAIPMFGLAFLFMMLGLNHLKAIFNSFMNMYLVVNNLYDDESLEDYIKFNLEYVVLKAHEVYKDKAIDAYHTLIKSLKLEDKETKEAYNQEKQGILNYTELGNKDPFELVQAAPLQLSNKE